MAWAWGVAWVWGRECLKDPPGNSKLHSRAGLALWAQETLPSLVSTTVLIVNVAPVLGVPGAGPNSSHRCTVASVHLHGTCEESRSRSDAVLQMETASYKTTRCLFLLPPP